MFRFAFFSPFQEKGVKLSNCIFYLFEAKVYFMPRQSVHGFLTRVQAGNIVSK